MPLKPAFHKPLPDSLSPRDEARSERSKFYASAAWRKLRKSFLDENPLCERCLLEGKLTPSRIAHHRVERLDDPDLAYDPANLEAVCDAHHTQHHARNRRRS
jgi:5-methylcytosine-specific restriction protein A